MKQFYFFCLFSTLILQIVAQNCPKGLVENANGDACLYPVTLLENYDGCTHKCWLQRGVVAQPKNGFINKQIQQIIAQNLSNQLAYIGVIRQSGNWVYSDGTTLTYQNWAPGQPSSTSNLTNCAIMSPSTGQWKAVECNIERTTVCSILFTDLPCPEPTWNFLDSNQQCYFVPNFTKTDQSHLVTYQFDESKALCQKKNAQLASIHSQVEDQFVYGLVSTNLKNASLPYSDPCDFSYAWIGLIGDGNQNSTWVDGSMFDYQGMKTFSTNWLPWKIGYDESCGISKWIPVSSSVGTARFVCKADAKPRAN